MVLTIILKWLVEHTFLEEELDLDHPWQLMLILQIKGQHVIII